MKRPKGYVVPVLPDIDFQNNVNQKTHWAQRLVNETRHKLARFDVDPDRGDRVAACMCRACWYLRNGGLVGQAFTHRPCDVCATMITHPNTATPKTCPECAGAYRLCRACGGDMDMQPREEVVPPKRKADRAAWWANQRQLEETRMAAWRAAANKSDP